MHALLKRMMRQGGYMEAADGGDGIGGGGGGGDDAASKIAAGLAAEAAAKAAEAAADAAAKAAADAAKGDDGGKGGKKPTDEEARLLKESMARKEALKVANEALAAAQTQLKEFEGLDPTELKKLVADKKAAEEAALAAKGDWERLKTRMADEHVKETGALKATIAALQTQLNSSTGKINDMSIGQLFTTSPFIGEELTLTASKARVIYGDHFELSEQGEVVAYDKPKGAANRTALVDASGNSVTFDQALRQIVEADPEKDYLIKSKMKQGAGSETKTGTASKSTASKGDLDATAKIASGLKSLGLSK